MPEHGAVQQTGLTTLRRVWRGSDFYSRKWLSRKWRDAKLLLRSLISSRGCWLDYGHKHVVMKPLFTRESSNSKASPPVTAESPCTSTCFEMPLLQIKGHSSFHCCIDSAYSRALPATSAKSAVVSMTGVGGAEVWQWFIPTPSEKWEEETGSGEGERWRLFQHLYPDTDPLLPAVLPQGTWCRKTSQLGWVAFLARALWQQPEECYLWHGLYITIFVCVRLNIYIYV